MSKRPHMPLGTKLQACLYALGMHGMLVEFDHMPPLAMRRIDPETGDTDPAANDPRYIVPMIKADHKIKTFGKPATTAGSDIHAIAHTRRLSKGEGEFRTRLLAKEPGGSPPKSSKIKGRQFRKSDKQPRRCAIERHRLERQ